LKKNKIKNAQNVRKSLVKIVLQNTKVNQCVTNVKKNAYQKKEKLVSEELKRIHVGKIGFTRTKIRDFLSKEYDEIDNLISKL